MLLNSSGVHHRTERRSRPLGGLKPSQKKKAWVKLRGKPRAQRVQSSATLAMALAHPPQPHVLQHELRMAALPAARAAPAAAAQAQPAPPAAPAAPAPAAPAPEATSLLAPFSARLAAAFGRAHILGAEQSGGGAPGGSRPCGDDREQVGSRGAGGREGGGASRGFRRDGGGARLAVAEKVAEMAAARAAAAAEKEAARAAAAAEKKAARAAAEKEAAGASRGCRREEGGGREGGGREGGGASRSCRREGGGASRGASRGWGGWVLDVRQHHNPPVVLVGARGEGLPILLEEGPLRQTTRGEISRRGGAASRNGQEARPLGARTRTECLARGRRAGRKVGPQPWPWALNHLGKRVQGFLHTYAHALEGLLVLV